MNILIFIWKDSEYELLQHGHVIYGYKNIIGLTVKDTVVSTEILIQKT